ncbi:hypothetical protein [Thorsellia anophelis]|uniref:Uncharacterized protein n=1 Tax=Thorsellia anophelis DSM 18579 TaxID=1123402 RepID=A0A1I0FKG5_9GAMM|nr:hypothetical protein [Thorsellia anophelis]SET58508.1 hypothetical protein SAMN02583745_02796 [Thorsellia anophelis DSM 18579]
MNEDMRIIFQDEVTVESMASADLRYMDEYLVDKLEEYENLKNAIDNFVTKHDKLIAPLEKTIAENDKKCIAYYLQNRSYTLKSYLEQTRDKLEKITQIKAKELKLNKRILEEEPYSETFKQLLKERFHLIKPLKRLEEQLQILRTNGNREYTRLQNLEEYQVKIEEFEELTGLTYFECITEGDEYVMELLKIQPEEDAESDEDEDWDEEEEEEEEDDDEDEDWNEDEDEDEDEDWDEDDDDWNNEDDEDSDDEFEEDEESEDELDVIDSLEDDLLVKQFRQILEICDQYDDSNRYLHFSESFFIEINQAYFKKDLSALENIYARLLGLPSAKLVDKAMHESWDQESEAEKYIKKLKILSLKYQLLTKENCYEYAIDIDKMDDYFSRYVKRLKAKINRQNIEIEQEFSRLSKKMEM